MILFTMPIHVTVPPLPPPNYLCHISAILWTVMSVRMRVLLLEFAIILIRFWFLNIFVVVAMLNYDGRKKLVPVIFRNLVPRNNFAPDAFSTETSCANVAHVHMHQINIIVNITSARSQWLPETSVFLKQSTGTCASAGTATSTFGIWNVFTRYGITCLS